MIEEILDRIRRFYRNSRIVRLMLAFLVIFLITGTLVALIEHGHNKEFRTIPDGWWWAIITFSTTGYGDKVPVTLAGRLITILTIFVGIAAMSLLTGTFASFFVDQNTRARRGLMELNRLQNHLIICGWKDDMLDILLEILRSHRGSKSDQIVIVSNVESEKIEALRGNKELEDLRFVRGDYFSELTLKRANVRTSAKVLVLADAHESASSSEVDSKSVMTVLTIKSMARDVYVVAELLDRKYESYLRQANCDEIVFTTDIQRSILANASATNGMSHIVEEMLFRKENAATLATIEIDGRFFGRPYGELRTHLNGLDTCVPLGLLENTGSPHTMKLEALRDAQKTSDVSMLVTNLQSVKGLSVNKPVLAPHDDYVVQRHSRAIVLERR
ncbi:MAG TPA: ion channel [Spirochaetia bacterium]|nr:ion channel [Spirochaetia bacterium]